MKETIINLTTLVGLMEEKWIHQTLKEKKNQKIEHTFVYNNIEEQMKNIIGTKVIVNPKANGKGKIEIEYYSEDELERIYDLIMSIQNK